MSAPTKCNKCGATGTFAISVPCAMQCGGTIHYDHGASQPSEVREPRVEALLREAILELKMWPKGHVVHPPSMTYDETCGQCRVDAILKRARAALAGRAVGASVDTGQAPPSEAALGVIRQLRDWLADGNAYMEHPQGMDGTEEAVAALDQLVRGVQIPHRICETCSKPLAMDRDYYCEGHGKAPDGPEPVSDALVLIRRALAMRDYGDKPEIWDQVWRDVEDAAHRLGEALGRGRSHERARTVRTVAPGRNHIS